MFDRFQKWIAYQRLYIKRKIAERASAVLRDFINGGGAISNETIEAVVRSNRTTVSAMLTQLDPELAHRALCFSQEGEDLILQRLFAGRSCGFYVDVGAHHPFRFSNTYLLHKAGWRGINIDATPGTMREFELHRPDDINIECFVGDPATEKTITLYNEPALNSASQDVIASRVLPTEIYWPIGTTTIRPRSLSDILDEMLPQGMKIALLNIDVEGGEQDVLNSNDWARYSPDIIVIEQLSTNIDESLQHLTTEFLEAKRYRLVAKAFNSSFFALQ